MKELRIDYEGRKVKGDLAKMVTRRKAELVENMSCTASQTHGFKLQNIRTKHQVKEEGKRKPKPKASFQLTNGSGMVHGTSKMQRITQLFPR